MRARLWFAASAAILGVAVGDREAWAIINQVDGTVVPVTTRMQSCLDKSTVAVPVPGDGPGVLDQTRDAAIRPQTFLPDTADATGHRYVTVYDVGEGAGYQNRFGWYHVGDSPFVATNRHEVFDNRTTGACDCPCLGGARAATRPLPPAPAASCFSWSNNNIVRIDFACLAGLPVGNTERWDGRPIAFYLLTPEYVDGTGSTNPPPVSGVTAGHLHRIYSTDNTVNDDGDYVHFLIYRSRSFTNAFYFGFEDLFRGGDNDFEDMLTRVNGLVASCNPTPEVCDGRDNNCDGMVDEGVTQPCSTACGNGVQQCLAGSTAATPLWGACSARTPAAETCNNVDDNCNGQVDEGLTQACTNAAYPAGTRCRTGVQYCQMGAFGACVTPAPTTETCNGLDDNCDGNVDENLGNITCGVGACRRTVPACMAGTPQTCTAGAPTTETCNGLDDNCNGQIDEGLTQSCTNSAFPAGTPCRTGVQVCSNGMYGTCVSPTPSAEVCDGVDNNCDGAVDEGLGSTTCGVGACQRTVQNCASGRPQTCMPGSPGTETCNGLDDNCNGVVDENLTQACTNSMYPAGSRCSMGTQACTMGTFAGAPCVSPTPSTEVCDGIDNNCNGMVDEGFGNLTCGVGVCQRTVPACAMGRPGTCTPGTAGTEDCNGLDDDCNGLVDDGLLRSCMGTCGTGTQRCVMGMWGACTAPTGAPELCNGLDDDCNGMIDDNVPPGGPCGSSVGACRAGTFACVGGRYVCQGDTQPTAELCDGIDNNCNGQVDEGNPGGGAVCNTAPDGTALCAPGTMVCRGGALVCDGGRPGAPEVCNCRDDNCNGQIDEDASGSLCAGGARCIDCECRTPCRSGEFPCSAGQRCEMGFCVPDLCGGVRCRSDQLCVNNACVDPCSQVQCRADQVCRGGVCMDNSCYTQGCPLGQLCRGARCVADPCAGRTCAAGQFCNGSGQCVASCGAVACNAGEQCVAGQCVNNPCASVQCPAGQSCRNGTCAADRCASVRCSNNLLCVDGTCTDSPCAGVRCTGAGETCSVVNGSAQCFGPGGQLVLPARNRIVNSGGGLIACAVHSPGAPEPGGGRGVALAAAVLALVVARRRAQKGGAR